MQGEQLLLTCEPLLPKYIIEMIAKRLQGSVFDNKDGRAYRIMRVRVAGRKIYGTCQELRETVPYIFTSVEE